LNELLALPGVHGNLVPDAHLAALALTAVLIVGGVAGVSLSLAVFGSSRFGPTGMLVAGRW
jgi:hypothetical protein